MVKLVSMQPLPQRNPHCGSWSRLSSIGLKCKIIAMALHAIPRSVIPL